MTGTNVRVWLADIKTEIAGIRSVTAEGGFDSFAASWAATRAVEHALLIIAEAAKHIPAHVKATRPEVPWQKIHGLGNLLRHEYRRIDPAIIWSVVCEQLDLLEVAVHAMERDLAKGGC